MNNPLRDSYDSIIAQLYHGDVYPSEQIVPDSKEYKEASQDLRDGLDEISKMLLATSDSEQVSSTVDNLMSLINIRCGAECYDHFAYGFKLGVRMMFDALSGKSK